ncbi:MAG: FG-GAP-like repeat-containing protein [Armatimonadota bacterium]
MMTARWMVASLLFLFALGPVVPAGAAQFEEISESVSILGSLGVAWADFDGDGYPDLFIPAIASGFEASPHGFLLYRNNHDLSFTDVSATLGLPSASAAAGGVATGDYNNDGRLDVLAAGAMFPFLFRRDATQFTQVDAEAGFDLYHNSGASVSWCDYDGDGLLDAFCSNLFGPGYLMHNNGDGTFTESSEAAGMTGDASNDQAQSAAWGDCDNDGWPDLLLARLAKPAKLYHNNGDGTFADVSASAGVSVTGGGMAATWADYNNDGWLDCYLVASVAGGASERDWLFHNNRDGTFTDVGLFSGMGADNQNGMGAAWADYDNDGYLDLYVSVLQSGAMPLLYHNNGNGTFTDVFGGSGLTGRDSEVAAAWGDIDLDGRPDLFQALPTPTSRLFHNVGPAANWLRVRALTSGTGNATSGDPARDALGARVDLNLDNDGTFPTSGYGTIARTIDGGYGYGAQGEPVAHFGLGSAALVAVRVGFPDGSVVVHRSVPANQQITIRDVPADRTEIFDDVPLDFWAYEQVRECVDSSIVAGYDDGLYHPDWPVTRDQMAVYITRALVIPTGDAAIPEGPATPSFSDVPSNHWAYKHIEYAVSQQVVMGYEDGTYKPNLVVDRGTMAVYIARAIAGGWQELPLLPNKGRRGSVTPPCRTAWCGTIGRFPSGGGQL